jgi:prepilin-type processing-associated H-X9-DG protein
VPDCARAFANESTIHEDRGKRLLMSSGTIERGRANGFTRAEVLSIVIVTTVLICLINSLAATSENTSRTAVCMFRMKQLALAWQFYADENAGRLVPSLPVGSSPAWVGGIMTWDLSSDNTNTALLRKPEHGLLGPYLAARENVHKCPEDNYLSPVQRRRFKQRVRGVAMNGTLGSEFPLSNPLYATGTHLRELIIPGPAKTTVFVEEHPDSIGDGRFVPPQKNVEWFDPPAAFHNGGGTFTFADGHVEMHRWRGRIRNLPVRYGPSFFVSVGAGDPDLKWMSYHSQRTTEQSF